MGAGPTGVALIQNRGWTVGVLANQNWSYAGDSNRPDVNQTFVQPFVSYTTKDAWTFTVDTESTFDWVNHQWSVPINVEMPNSSNLALSPSNSKPASAIGPTTPTRGHTTWAHGSMSSSCSPLRR